MMGDRDRLLAPYCQSNTHSRGWQYELCNWYVEKKELIYTLQSRAVNVQLRGQGAAAVHAAHAF